MRSTQRNTTAYWLILSTLLFALAIFCASCGPHPEDIARMRFERMASSMEKQALMSEDAIQTPESRPDLPVYAEIISTDAENYDILEQVWQQANTKNASRTPSSFQNAGFRLAVLDGSPPPAIDSAKEKLKYFKATDMILLINPAASSYMPIGKGINQPSFNYEGTRYSSRMHDFSSAMRYLRMSVRKTPSGDYRVEIVPVLDQLFGRNSGLDMNDYALTVTLKPAQSIILGETGVPNSPSSALLTRRADDKLQREVIILTPVQ